MGLIFVASHTPGTDVPNLWFWKLPHADKIGHGIMYFVLALTFYVPLSRRTVPDRPGLAAFLAALLSVLYGFTDEMHQSMVPGRTPAWDDIVADLVGAGIAALLAGTLGSRR
jgi:VanZ family protein